MSCDGLEECDAPGSVKMKVEGFAVCEAFLSEPGAQLQIGGRDRAGMSHCQGGGYFATSQRCVPIWRQ